MLRCANDGPGIGKWDSGRLIYQGGIVAIGRRLCQPYLKRIIRGIALWMCSKGVALLPRKLPKAVELRAEAKVILNRWQQAMARSEADIAKSIELGDTILEDALHHESELQAYDFEIQLAMLDNRLIKPSNPPPELRPEHLEALRHFRSNSES